MSRGTQKKEHIIVGLDIGTSKAAVIIGALRAGDLDIVGVGQAPCSGMRQGVVVNIDATTTAIRKAVEEAELMSGYQVEEVWLGVAGNHIQSFDSRGMIAIKNSEVAANDIERVLEAAKAVNVPAERQVLHVLPRDFKVDDQEGIFDPIGMTGVRLEASVHIVTGGRTALQNTIKCIEKAGLKVKGVVLQQLASSFSVLSDDEKKLGVALVDIGAGTSDILCFDQGSMAYTGVVPVGGAHFTHDVAVGLRTPQSSAETIKKRFGCALGELVSDDETIEVDGVGGRKARSVQRRYLSEVIEPRAEETLALIRENIESSGLMPRLGSGIVFTGGGSLLHGFVEMAEFFFDVPVRLGVPNRVRGLKEVVQGPTMATAMGLLIYAFDKERAADQAKAKESNWNLINDFSRKIKDLLS